MTETKSLDALAETVNLAPANTSEAWEGEGRTARLAGKAMASCPYANGTPQNTGWAMGWITTDTELFEQLGDAPEATIVPAPKARDLIWHGRLASQMSREELIEALHGAGTRLELAVLSPRRRTRIEAELRGGLFRRLEAMTPINSEKPED